MWHEGILRKLKSYGFSGCILEWFESYLSDRQQRVIIEGYQSNYKSMAAGVPQGSVLGPFLFILFINDIASEVSANIKLFADDTSLFVIVDASSPDSGSVLNNDLKSIENWASTWDVNFNPAKTVTMFISRKQNRNQPLLYFNNQTVTENTKHTHLGVTFNQNATWSDHIQNIYTKAYSRLNILRMLKHKIDRKSLETLYSSYIRPSMEYAGSLWDCCTKAESDLLESVQLEALRIISGLRRGTSHVIIYNETLYEPLQDRRQKHKLKLMHKIVNHQTPQYLYDIISPHFHDNNGRYELRNSRMFEIPQCRTESYKKASFLQLWQLSTTLIMK